MRVITDSVDVDLGPEDLRHFKLDTAQSVREFIDIVRIEGNRPPGFKTEK